MHDDRDGKQVLEDEPRQDARSLAHLADLGSLAGLLTVAPGAIGDDLGLGVVGSGRDEDLAIAVGGDEGLLLPRLKLPPEARREGPRVGEERAGVAAHERAGQGDRRDSGKLDQAVGGLLLG